MENLHAEIISTRSKLRQCTPREYDWLFICDAALWCFIAVYCLVMSVEMNALSYLLVLGFGRVKARSRRPRGLPPRVPWFSVVPVRLRSRLPPAMDPPPQAQQEPPSLHQLCRTLTSTCRLGCVSTPISLATGSTNTSGCTSTLLVRRL